MAVHQRARLVADLVVTAVGTVLLGGLAVGWRVKGTAAGALGAVGLLLLFRLACTWVGILLGLLSRSEEAAGQLGASTFALPLLSNSYIPTENPGPPAGRAAPSDCRGWCAGGRRPASPVGRRGTRRPATPRC